MAPPQNQDVVNDFAHIRANTEITSVSARSILIVVLFPYCPVVSHYLRVLQEANQFQFLNKSPKIRKCLFFPGKLLELCLKSLKSVKTAVILKREGSDMNSGKRFLRTPLMKAAKYGHIKFVDILIIQGADVNLLDESFSTALIRGADKGNSDCFKALITATARADINVANVHVANVCRQNDYLQRGDEILQAEAEVDLFKRRLK